MNIIRLNSSSGEVIKSAGNTSSNNVRLQTKEVKIEQGGDLLVAPDVGYDGLKQVKIKAKFQGKSVNVTSEDVIEVTPDAGYSALSRVQVVPILQEKTIYKMGINGSLFVSADSGNVGLSKVNIVKKEIEDYLTIEALEDGLQVRTSISSYNNLEYCIDGNDEWVKLRSGTYTPSVNAGQKISFRASAKKALSSSEGIGTFTISHKCNVLGNIMSLVGGDDNSITTVNEYHFKYLFKGCKTIISCKNLLLPATTLDWNCYQGMFDGCTSLVDTPTLPATTVANYCYSGMFAGCTSLVNAPALPATILKLKCYSSMFSGCTSLVNAPELPAASLYDSCYSHMFYGCTSLTTAPELPATTLARECYMSMFEKCSKLVNPPTLPATTLEDGCYYSMFFDCTSLVTAPALPAIPLKDRCYYNMFYNCTSLVNAPELPAASLKDRCYGYMFYSCKLLVNAPELPATTLKDRCYDHMFAYCNKLNYIKAMFTTTPSATYTEDWVRGVSSTGTFVKNSVATWNVTGINGIPEGWTVEFADA